MSYQFVKKEEILKEDSSNAPPPEGMECGQCGVDWSRLLKEREAYREVAMSHARVFEKKQDEKTGDYRILMEPVSCVEYQVDAEARRILEEKKP